ncbi:MAG: phosphate ABC transporter permease PstA [Actinomycetota bacterium]|nr:phosphate ABC transporter permease PstA [Actinomycetota bacterium]
MTTTETPAPAPERDEPSEITTHDNLSPAAHAGIGVGSLVLGFGVAALWTGGLNIAWGVIFTAILYVISIYFVTRSLEGHRAATDRLATAVMTSAFLLVLLPLVSVAWTTIENGAARFDWQFFTEDMRSVVGYGGGGYHAIVGTLIMTGLTALISVPFGIMVAVYLVEYGQGTKLAKSITTMVDVMTGIPSIVAGLFAYGLFVVFYGPGYSSGIGGAVALSVLMTPVVVRSAEEMLRLVPNELREAAYALGVPKWKTITKVVLPTSIAGILTGVTLAIARVIGETAPLLIVAGFPQGTNWNPFDGRMGSLPVMAYYSYTAPGVPPEAGYERAWTAALVLILIVAILFAIARVIAKVLQPKGLR